ncbi:hypothetical protein ACFE04_010771 [Oxalis oulophora]
MAYVHSFCIIISIILAQLSVLPISARETFSEALNIPLCSHDKERNCWYCFMLDGICYWKEADCLKLGCGAGRRNSRKRRSGHDGRLHPSEPGPRVTERPRQGRERRSDGVSCITFLYHERRSERQAMAGGCICRRKPGKTPPVDGVSCIMKFRGDGSSSTRVEVVVSSVVVVVE